MNTLIRFEIPKRNAQCAYQGEKLMPGMDMYSLLLEDDKNQIIRHDFCASCWAQVRVRKEEQALARGYWKSKIEAPKILPNNSERIVRAFALLHALQQEKEVKEAEIFVLCLFLAHARQLALRQEFKKEESFYYLYEILRKEEFLTIKVIHLSQIQIEILQKSIADQLGSLER